jgi:DNA-binding NarL/FixJ family response regulator
MIRVLVAEDQSLFRKGIVVSLSRDSEIVVVGEAENGLDACDAVERLKPDLVLMDLNMPVMDGVEATRRIKAAHPETRVVVLTVSDLYRDLVEALKAGADGYLLKTLGPDNLASAVRQAQQGDSPISGGIAAKILSKLRQSTRSDGSGFLSARELAVLQFATEGLSYKEISAKLCLADSTVKNHMRHIMEKLHLRNRSEAITYALHNGLVEDPLAGEGL